MPRTSATNTEIAELLDRIADLLAAKEENPFRVRSYRNAANAIRETQSDVAAIAQAEGLEGLTRVKGIGEKLAGLIQEYVEKGNVELLQTLEKEVPADSLKKITQAKHVFEKPIAIPVALVLEIDNEYREKASAGKLKKIAPRQFNPEKKAWLPVMVKATEGYKFTVMFSNTETAHKLGKTDDWVVVYYEKGKGENQCTVVTESRGAMKGRRIIRGRENECAQFYETSA